VKKLAALGLGAIAAASMTLIAPGVADSSPGSGASLNVVGEPYGRAIAILKSQGVKARFKGAVGSAYPQAECIVSQQTVTKQGQMLLSVNCTKEAVEAAQSNLPSGGYGGGGPSVGGNGITTVTATPVAPPPEMPIPGA
jgi:hypothetical protein